MLPSGLAGGQQGRKHAVALGAAGHKRIGVAPDTPAIPEEGNSEDDDSDDSDDDSDQDSSQEAEKKEEPAKDRRKAFAAASKAR